MFNLVMLNPEKHAFENNINSDETAPVNNLTDLPLTCCSIGQFD